MKRIRRSLRISTWLMQSFIKRYKRYVLLAAGLSAIFVLILWQILPLIQKSFFPEKTIVAIVGLYEPNNLPLSVQNYISAGFTQIGENGEALPLAATKWEVTKEGTRYFFHFDPDIYWHDGEQFTAHDVNYNFRDVQIEAADRFTLKMDLQDPFSPLPTLLSRPLFKRGLVGIGPYKVRHIIPEGNFVDTLLVEKSEYNVIPKDLPYDTELIEFRFYPSIESAIQAFKLGEIDHIDNVPNKTILADEQNVIVTETAARNQVLALFYNTTHDLLGSKEFRQALSYATPELEGVQIDSAVPSSSWAYNENARTYNTDTEKAEEILTEMGIENPSVILSVFPEYLDQAELIKDAWEALGVQTTIQVIRSFPPQYDIILGLQEIPSDPDQYQLWHSTQHVTNITHYNNPKIDKLLEDGRTRQLKEEREEVYKEFQRYIMEDVPAHFLIHPKTYTISRK